jgi:acyl-lipid omega-6 desaturase (Delta-12 desaturase)
MSTNAAEDAAWRQILSPYKKPNRRSALVQLINTLVPFVVIWVALVNCLMSGAWLLAVPLTLLASGFYVRLFVLQHDCGHGSFFPNRHWNNRVGAFLGVLTLFPYGYWRRTHSVHHATSGNLTEREIGDVKTLTVNEYLARTWGGRFGYRLYRNPLVMFGLGPFYQFVLKHRLPFDIPFSWKREWASALWTNVALVVLYGSLCTVLPWQAVVGASLLITTVAGAAGIWLFYVQHQFEETYWAAEGAWDFFRAGMHGSSYYDLPPVLRWLTANIGYHHIHHLASNIPNYRLQECFEAEPAMRQAHRLTIASSLRCARLRLWDEAGNRMIGWRELRALRAQRRVAETLAA